MIKTAIILAGGLGTRLRSVVPELPKCMAPVNGRPFLHYVLGHLRSQGVTDYIFSLGYKSDVITGYVERLPRGAGDTRTCFSVEEEPLGTGGAVRLALTRFPAGVVLVVNGDTLFRANLAALGDFHTDHDADCTLSLKPMTDFDRYGAVELNADLSIRSFREKQFYASGLINGGVYALNAARFLRESFPERFSFETDYLQKFTAFRRFYGLAEDAYFIDIGIPADYERAQRELAKSEADPSPDN